MTFTANFSPAGMKLTAANPAFTLLFGTDDLITTGNGVQRTVAGTAHTLYATYADGAPNRAVNIDLTSLVIGAFVYATVTNGQPSYYYLRGQTGSTSCRLFRIVNGAGTQVAVSSTTTNLNGLVVSASINASGNPVIVVTQGGTTILNFTDTDPTKLTSGVSGVGTLSTGSTGNNVMSYSDSSSNGPATTLTFNERLDGFVFEAIAGSPAIMFDGTKPSSVGAIERQVELEDGTVVSAWSTAGMSAPTTTSWRWTNTTLPKRTDGKDYLLRLREAANTLNTVLQFNRWAVGVVLVINDQSLDDIMSGAGKPPANGAVSSIRANPHRVMDFTNRGVAASAAARITRLTGPSVVGSGYTVLVDEIQRWIVANSLPNYPIMIVHTPVSGQTMTDWNANTQVSGWTWGLLDFLTFALAQAGGRISALKRNIVVWSDTPASAVAAMAQIVSNVEARLPNQPGGYTFPVWVRGAPRATRPASEVLKIRAAAKAAGTQGGRFRQLCAPVIDMQLEGPDQLHQADGAQNINNGATAHIQGNRRLGFRDGRGTAALLQELYGLPITIDRFGPQVVSRQFTSAAKTAYRRTYDRDTKIPDGTTTGIPQIWISTDNRATWTQVTARKTGARTYEIDHPTGGSWVGQTVWDAYAVDSPWDTTGGANGGENNVTSLLAKLIYDANDFGEGTEMVAALSEGQVVDAGGSVTINIEATVAGGNTLAVALEVQPS